MELSQNEIDLRPEHLSEVKRLIKSYLPDTEVWAYGSRVKGLARKNSDLDLVAFSDKDDTLLFQLKEAFEESYLPFRVDLFAWQDLPESFHQNILEHKVILQQAIKSN